MLFKEDAFINEEMSEKIEDCLNFLGTFYKRVSAIDGVKSVVGITSVLDNGRVSLTFSNKKIKEAGIEIESIDFGVYKDTTFDEIIEMNVEKLEKRYPGGSFDVHHSENRVEGDL